MMSNQPSPAFAFGKTQDTTPLKPWYKILRELIYTPEILLCSGGMPPWSCSAEWCAWYLKAATYRSRPPHMSLDLVQGIWFITGILEGYTLYDNFPIIPVPNDDDEDVGLHWIVFCLSVKMTQHKARILAHRSTDQELLAHAMEQRAQLLKDRQTASTPTPENTMRQTPTAASLAQEEFGLPSGPSATTTTSEQQNAIDAYSGEEPLSLADTVLYRCELYHASVAQMEQQLQFMVKSTLLENIAYEGVRNMLIRYCGQGQKMKIQVTRNREGVIKSRIKVSIDHQEELPLLLIEMSFAE